MDLSLMIETLEKEVKSDDQRFSMSNTRKADLVFSIKKDLEIIEGDISKFKHKLKMKHYRSILNKPIYSFTK